MASALSPPTQGRKLQTSHAPANATHVTPTPTKAFLGSTLRDERRGTYGSYSLRHLIHVIRPPPELYPLNPRQFRTAPCKQRIRTESVLRPLPRSRDQRAVPPTCSPIKATFGSNVNQTVTIQDRNRAADRPRNRRIQQDSGRKPAPGRDEVRCGRVDGLTPNRP
jgi:hypothetical protein